MKKILFILVLFSSLIFAKTAEEYARQCEAKDAQACKVAGVIYMDRNDYAKAILYIKKCSQLGKSECFSALGTIYE